MLQDKRFKNRELQIIRMMDHPNVVLLKHCFFSVTEADERYLHLVLEFIPSTVYKCALPAACCLALLIPPCCLPSFLLCVHAAPAAHNGAADGALGSALRQWRHSGSGH